MILKSAQCGTLYVNVNPLASEADQNEKIKEYNDLLSKQIVDGAEILGAGVTGNTFYAVFVFKEYLK